jgi:hypothetical protein
MATKSEVEDTIKSILDRPSVGKFEIKELSKDGDGEFSGICRIAHSEAFNQTLYRNVNGFDEIEFNALFTSDDQDGVRYEFFVFEDKL